MPITIHGGSAVDAVTLNSSALDAVTVNGSETVWSAGPSYPPYLTFSSAGSFTLETVLNDTPWDGTMEYSTDAENWTTWGGEAINSSANGGVHYLYVRGIGNTVVSGGDTGMWMFGGGSDIYCNGDIRTLLDYSDPDNTTMAQSCFSYLFAESSLVLAPDLPSETLSTGCYNSMFYGCTALTIAPDLPALVLAPACYGNMYNGCTALGSHPKISATTGANTAFNGMFSGCTSLTELCELNITEFSISICSTMYKGCSFIKISDTQTGEYQTPYRLPATGTGTSKTSAFTNMFQNTGGTFTGSPTVNTTYYTANTIVG